MWSAVVLVLLAASLRLDGLDSNLILQRQQDSGGDTADGAARHRTETSFSSNRRQKECGSADCTTPMTDGCSNRARGRDPVPQGTQLDRQANGEGDKGSKTKVPEMAGCVRSSDCQPGLCCVRYLNVKRCQRIPVEGDACLLRGRSKAQRRLGRCDCAAGLRCAAGRPELPRGQGVCIPRQSLRKTRHSGKKRRTAEGGC